MTIYTTRFTKVDVERKVQLVNDRLTREGLPHMYFQSTNPDGSGRRFEFAGNVYKGAAEACRALDAMLAGLNVVRLTDAERAYVARAIDVARSDAEAAAL